MDGIYAPENDHENYPLLCSLTSAIHNIRLVFIECQNISYLFQMTPLLVRIWDRI